MTGLYTGPRAFSQRTNIVRRKCFISYHHADAQEVYEFIQRFDHEDNALIYRGLGLKSPGMADEIIDSYDTDYVMRRIRELYLKDSTVTIVMVGRCTWARRYVDWEVQASLRSGETVTPNGLLAIQLPSARATNLRPAAPLPERVGSNILRDRDRNNMDIGYGRYIAFPDSTQTLVTAIEEAYQRRTTDSRRIINVRPKFTQDLGCT